MKKKTIYIAFNGKEFEDEIECEKYEKKELQDKDLLVYNKEDELVPLNEKYHLAQEGVYVICKTKEALNYLNETFEYNYVNEIDYDDEFPVSFYYDFKLDEWKEIKSRIKELQNEIDVLSKYIVKE